MFMVTVMALDGTIEDVVGPFWYEDTAHRFQLEAETRYHKRCAVRRVREKEEWKASQ